MKFWELDTQIVLVRHWWNFPNEYYTSFSLNPLWIHVSFPIFFNRFTPSLLYIYIYRSLINIVVMKESFKDSLNIFLVAVPSTNILQFYKICGVRINPWLILIRVKQTYIRTIFKLSCHENEKSRKNIFFHILGLLFQVESDVFQADFDYKDALYVSVVDNVAYAWMSEKHEERTVVSAWDCTWRVKISARGNLWAEAECKPLRHRHSFVWISFDGDTRKDEQPSMATPGVFMNFNAV